MWLYSDSTSSTSLGPVAESTNLAVASLVIAVLGLLLALFAVVVLFRNVQSKPKDFEMK